MEGRGLVEAEWVAGDQGPNKKIYKLTEEGRTAASKWIELLKFRKAQLQLIIDKYEKNSREVK
jgi:DNA-binding PadR family transcriptional regulator